MKRIIFLYTELAGYFVSCLRELAKLEVEIHVFRWEVNKEAPFQFDFPEGTMVYQRGDYNDHTLVELCKTIQPHSIICSGWVDKGYLKVCKHFVKQQTTTVLTLDNHWNGLVKQQVARIISPFYIRKIFSDAWVPGQPQKEYALKLGFPEQRIKTGFYCADVGLFEGAQDQRIGDKPFPKRLFYMGRYVQQKGLPLLFKSFIELKDELSNDWELWCVGTGDLFDERIEHPAIRHIGFVQPQQLKEYLPEVGVFVLPSLFEPWGVVVHEMAVAGFPMICSSSVGAATKFVNDGSNGYIFNNGDFKDLKDKIRMIMQKNEDELKNMAQSSISLGKQWIPSDWAKVAASF